MRGTRWLVRAQYALRERIVGRDARGEQRRGDQQHQQDATDERRRILQHHANRVLAGDRRDLVVRFETEFEILRDTGVVGGAHADARMRGSMTILSKSVSRLTPTTNSENTTSPACTTG